LKNKREQIKRKKNNNFRKKEKRKKKVQKFCRTFEENATRVLRVA